MESASENCAGEKCAGALDGRNKLFVMKSKSLIHLDDANHLERHLLIKTFTMFLAFSITDHPFIRSATVVESPTNQNLRQTRQFHLYQNFVDGGLVTRASPF